MSTNQGFLMPDLGALQEEIARVEERSSKSGSNKKGDLFFYNFKEGDNNLIFLPPWDPKTKQFYRRVYKMYKLPPDNENHICIEKTDPDLGKPCPILSTLRTAKTMGKSVKRQMPVEKNHWQVLDLDGEKKNIEMEIDGKKEMVEVDFRYQPQIISLSPKTHDGVFQLFMNPETSTFIDPHNAIPVEINFEKGTGNAFNKYTVRPMRNFNAGKKEVVRMPIADTPEKIYEIVGKLNEAGDDWEIKPKLFDLNAIFKSPVKELEAPDGNIYKCAEKLKAFYGIKPGAVQQQVQATPATTTPGIQPTTAPVHMPKKEATLEQPKVEENQQQIEEANSQDGADEVTKAQEIHGPRDMVKREAEGQKLEFPGSPSCFGTYDTVSKMPSAMEGGQYHNGVLIPQAEGASACDACPFSSVCKSS